jgi:TfoX/Sxy family transcriptional regulator of competence genes
MTSFILLFFIDYIYYPWRELMAYDTELAHRIRNVLQDRTGVSEKKMFGGLAFMLDDYMFVGITENRLMVRVGPERHEEALAQPHISVMDFTGRPMKGYIYVAPAGIESDGALRYWVDQGATFVQSLPPKQARKKRN